MVAPRGALSRRLAAWSGFNRTICSNTTLTAELALSISPKISHYGLGYAEGALLGRQAGWHFGGWGIWADAPRSRLGSRPVVSMPLDSRLPQWRRCAQRSGR